MSRTFTCLIGAVALASIVSYAQAPPAAQPPRPPTRPADGPGAPKWTVVGAKPGETALKGAPGMNAPVDAEGDFLIGPDYLPAKELDVVDGVPRGSITQFAIESVNSRFYPGIARERFGTV